MKTSVTRTPRVIAYVRLVVVFILFIALAAIVMVSWQSYKNKKASELAIDYHMASSHHVALINKELLGIRKRLDDLVRLRKTRTAGTELLETQHAITQSTHIIKQHTNHLVSIQDNYRFPEFSALVIKLQTQLKSSLSLDKLGLPEEIAKTNIHPSAINAILLTLEQLERLHQIANRRLARQGVTQQTANVGSLIIFIAIALVLGWVVLGRTFTSIRTILRNQKQAEDSLIHEKEQIQITLESIGDAVITTNSDGMITYLNPVAEELTEWSNNEAQGLPLNQVFNIFNEETGHPATEIVRRVLREGHTVGLANHTMLVSRHGKKCAIEDSAAPIINKKGQIDGIVVVFHDVTHARNMAQEMSWQASHDGLTGLTNRHRFEEHLDHLLASAVSDDTHHAFLYLDLDQFKIVNDTCGHIAGDELLKQVATLLRSEVRDADMVARLGGDEFGVLLETCPMEQAKNIANTIREAIQEFRFVWQEKLFVIGVSIGLVPITPTSGDKNDIMRDADVACYAAKDVGRNRVHVYQPDDQALAMRQGEMEWVSRINDALEKDRFRLYHQTIVPLASSAQQGERFEILLRMLDGNDKLIPPMSFLPAAERYNLMPAIDRWVIHATFEMLARKSDKDIDFCAINISGHSLADDPFLDFVLNELEHQGLSPTKICFEITETAAITNFPQAIHFISTLQKKGCRFALDDFGSGLSSFGYLKNLPVNYLKIDGTFVRDMLTDPIDRAMVESINNIGHIMSIQTIAEFVENKGIADALIEMGIDYGQGYGLSVPEPL